MKPIVCKFGGTSMATAEQVRKVERIIRSDPRRRGVVVSAPGKRMSSDQKITDLLYLCQSLASKDMSFEEPWSVIRARYLEMERDLGVTNLNMAGLLSEIEARLKKGATPDEAASRGEFLMAKLFAAYLGATFVDAYDGIVINRNGLPDQKTYDRLGAQLSGEGLFVVPGFYGRDPKGRLKTFSRGGSDVTGAIVARAMKAEMYENWTDTSGFLMCDPRIVPEARPMPEVTYREIRELAYMGAQVFHDEAIFPVKEAKIPINIRNTNAPDQPGTLIQETRNTQSCPIVGIAGQKGFSLIFVEKYFMNKERGVGRRLLEVFERNGVSYEITPTGIDSISVVVRDEEIVDKTEQIIDDIKRAIEPDRVDVVGGLALIATVGEGMEHRVGTAATLCKALADNQVNISIMDQGPGELNILVGVQVKDFQKAIQSIYRAFVNG